jgi:hypothetical protein
MPSESRVDSAMILDALATFRQQGSMMTRSADDTWDAASGVGATATMIAAIRARSSKVPHAIINDPFAEPRTRRLTAIV